MNWKHLLRTILYALHLDVRKGMRYDRQTVAVMKKILRRDSSCIDVGAHTGEILKIMLHIAPEGEHFAFEPLPALHAALKRSFHGPKVHVFDTALSSTKGTSTFQHVVNAPAYSGLKRRRYDTPDVTINEITVQTDLLDTIIPADAKIAFIKIDVEGGELDVLKGGVQTIRRCKPVIVFECGAGASDFYGATADAVFDCVITTLGLKLTTMQRWLKSKPPLTREEFQTMFTTNSEFYFLANQS